MRRSRLRVPEFNEGIFYHLTSRVVDKQPIFTDLEKERFVKEMRRWASFCQVQVVTFNIMSTHFHLVVREGSRPEVALTGDQLVEYYLRQGEREIAEELQHQLEGYRKRHDTVGEARFLEKRLARMWNVSAFMQALKQSFSQDYNRRHERSGTLWEGRFKSTVCQGGRSLLGISSYVDLNMVRGWGVEDPKDYRWCGYAEAEAGVKKARWGVQQIIQEATRNPQITEEEAIPQYRQVLYQVGCLERKGADDQGRPKKGGFSREEVAKVLKNKGELEVGEYMRLRVRHFSDGVVIGSKAFVERVYEENREKIGRLRKAGAKRLRGLKEEIYSLRDWKTEEEGAEGGSDP